MENNQNLCMDWNDTIESDGQAFVLLDEGDYNFTVTGFERGRFPGSAKIPACNKAAITVQVETAEGTASVKFDLILFRNLEWKISSFFRCIGQKKHGEKLTMDWNRVSGSCGRAHFKPRKYTNNYGEEKEANDLDYFIDYDPKYFTAAPSYASQTNANFVEITDDDDLPFN